MANWFECKIRYDKTQENGSIKKVTEPYLVDAPFPLGSGGFLLALRPISCILDLTYPAN